jgi:hypothetical protein
VRNLNSAKIFFCLAVLLFVAKPFLGFSMFSRSHPPAAENIFVKAFTKRKLEDSENNNFNSIVKKTTDPVRQFVLRFSFLLGILFPGFYIGRFNISNLFLKNLRLSLSPPEHTWLLNGKLII